MTATDDLLKTPLTDLHVERGGKLVAFAGYSMPVQFPDGVLKEHLHTRAQAGLFDVSHMGQVTLRARSGRFEDAALALERLVPVDILGLKQGRQRYALFTSPDGGILDDLMVANRGDHLFLVVNAACKAADIAHLKANLSDDCVVEELTDRALIALQGPAAESALAALAPEVAAMKFMDLHPVEILGADCFVSRSGYTGEDGYEISVPADRAVELAESLLANEAVRPIGLGARDSLRLEAGLCLYGNDIGPDTTPIAAALTWAIQKVRRSGGDRAGGFPGADVILTEFETGAPAAASGFRPRAARQSAPAPFSTPVRPRQIRSARSRPAASAPRWRPPSRWAMSPPTWRSPASRSMPMFAASACRYASPPFHSFPRYKRG